MRLDDKFASSNTLFVIASVVDTPQFVFIDTDLYRRRFAMVRESEVREKLLDVLHDELPLEEFAEWLASARRDMHLDSTAEAQDLVSSVSLLLYEHFEGHLSEARVLDELMSLVSQALVTIELASAEPRFLMSAHSTSLRPMAHLAILA